MNVSPSDCRARHGDALASRLSLSLIIALAFASLPVRLFAQQPAAGEPLSPSAAKTLGGEFVPGEALVRFRTEEEAETMTAAAEYDPDVLLPYNRGLARGVKRFGGEGIVPGLRLIKVDPARTLEALKALSRRPEVLYAEPNYVRHLRLTPNDPQFGSLYGLQRIGAPLAWNTTTGSQSVVVGVIDQGIDISHPDLTPNLWTNPGEIPDNGIDDDGDGYVDDVYGWDFVHNDKTVFDGAGNDDHGTHVAGIIGARGNNGIGVVGVNWQVSLMSLKVLDGKDASGTSAQLIAAYRYALMMRQRGVNLRALNNSYGGGGGSQAELDAIRALSNAGILFVAAAGNDARDNFSIPDFPANYDSPNVIAVASTNSAESLSSFSNFSSRLVSVGAPGSSVLSTTPNNTYSTFSGTSMATPHVTGSAALVVAAKPDITLQQLRGVLAFTGDLIPALQGKTTTGRRVNVANAVARALENDTTPPAQIRDLRIISQSGRSITLAWTAPGDDGDSGTAADYDFFFVNPATGLRVLMPTTLLPAAAGTQQTLSVDVPFRNFSGSIELRTYDDTGNYSTTSISVNVSANPSSDPYVVSESAAQGLSTGGTRLALDGDDKYLSYTLPISFPFFGQARTSLTVSTNGVLYFSTPPRRSNGDADDVPSSAAGLQAQAMIAALWDDLMVDTTQRADSGVFVVQPDSSRIIFRWQGVTYDSPRVPVNFEVELRTDGSIQLRYGDNPRVFPVVGIGGGEPSAYVVDSHTREYDGVSRPVSLTNAGTVTLAPRPNAQTVLSFSASSANVDEGAGRATLLVVRTGNTQGASSVDVRTVDNTALVRCDDTTTLPGVAFARCDYATTVQSVTFAPGETQKAASVPIIDDAFVEPNETVQVILTNPSADAALGDVAALTLTIRDNDVPGAPNPADNTSFFVRQHYLDFLSREPEAGEPWSATLNNCATGDVRCDRIQVSASFFGSPEFQLKGFFVFRFYRLSFGRLPLYAEIVPDMSSVTGQTPAEVYAKKAAFTNQWVQRQEFKNTYDALDNTAFVNALMNRYSLQSIRTTDPASPDTGAKVTLTRAQLVAALSGGGAGVPAMTRAQVVRAVADSDEVAAAESNRAFVAMQYFGYLRRDPEEPGFTNWLNTINANPNDYRVMVNGFLNSREYRLRFGPSN